MDYEKKYKEALERASGFKTAECRDVAEYIFPELKESEDEKIRQKFIKLVKMSNEVGGFALHKWEADEMLAWLEKQGEQKAANEVESKFKVGDWIAPNIPNASQTYGCYQVKEVKPYQYVIYRHSDAESSNCDMNVIDENFHLWSIKDAKDGDVLCYETENELRIFIYKNGHIHYHCHYCNGHLTTVDSFFVVEKYLLCYIHPATKEQRDLLFQKMKEEGYEWDGEKKKLREIDNEEVNGEDYGIDGLWHAQRILEKTLGSVDGYQTDDGILDHKAAITVVKKLYKQKLAWSEEDEEMCQETIDWFEKKCFPYALENDNPARESIKWLKSLKQRIKGE